MRFVFSALFITAISGCSMGELRRVDGQQIDHLGIGIVRDVAAIEIDSEESLGGRVAVGAASGGLIGGVATAITEPGFSEQVVHRYVVRLNDGTYLTQTSRSIIDVGTCVEITIREGQDYPILHKKKADSCVGD